MSAKKAKQDKPFPTAKVLDRGVEEGIEWVITKAPLYGAINGYVKIPFGHPWRHRDYETLNEHVEVHGSLTFGSASFAEGHNWVGFDTLHAGDYWPGDTNHFHDDWCRHWTQEKVVEETKSLARQIVAGATWTPPERPKVVNPRAKGWQEAHDTFCDFGEACSQHLNPYRSDDE